MCKESEGRIIVFEAEEKDIGTDVGTLLRSRGVSKRLITKLKRCENGIMLNGKHIRTIDTVERGDRISLLMMDSRSLEANDGIKVPVVYEDEDVIVFDKPVDMPVHPSIKHRGDTLGNSFSAMYPGLTFRPVNRLDKDTSGLCAVAKNAHAANVLQGTLEKVYYAVVSGNITENGRIDAPIGRIGESIIKREVRPDGQRAVTDYTIIKGNGRYTLLRVILQTGRTHQIRVHFSHIGHPLAGDDFYGGSLEDISHQALHCGELDFVSPVTKEKIHVSSPVREDMKSLLQ